MIDAGEVSAVVVQGKGALTVRVDEGATQTVEVENAAHVFLRGTAAGQPAFTFTDGEARGFALAYYRSIGDWDRVDELQSWVVDEAEHVQVVTGEPRPTELGSVPDQARFAICNANPAMELAFAILDGADEGTLRQWATNAVASAMTGE